MSDTKPQVAVAGDLRQLFHLLNNQLGIILANAELLEHRLNDQTHKSRAGQLVGSALEAIHTSQQIRLIALPPADDQVPQ